LLNNTRASKMKCVINEIIFVFIFILFIIIIF